MSGRTMRAEPLMNGVRAVALGEAAPACVAQAGAKASVPLTIECLSGLHGLDALAPYWDDVVERAGLRHPFVSYEWLRPWCETQADPGTLRFYVVCAGETIAGIAPVVEERGTAGRLVRRGLSGPHTPTLDFLVADRHEETWRLLWKAVAPRRSQQLQLQDLAEDGPTLAALEAQAREAGLPVGREPTLDSPYVLLNGTWETYQRSLSRQQTDALRKRMRRLSGIGEVRLHTVHERSEVPAAIERALWLEGAAWKRDAGTAISCDPSLVRFYTEIALRAADRGWLRLQFLTVNGDAIAFTLCLEYDRRMYSLKTGYDPAHAANSPGQLVFQLAIRDAFERGLDTFELLGASSEWKRYWTSRHRQHHRLTVLPDTAAARVAHAVRFRLVPAVRASRFYQHCRRWYHSRRRGPCNSANASRKR